MAYMYVDPLNGNYTFTFEDNFLSNISGCVAAFPKIEKASFDTGIPEIERIIFNPPCTIVLWKDGTKTVVRCMEGDKFSEEEGFLSAVGKKMFGSHTHYKNLLKNADRPDKDEKEFKKVVKELKQIVNGSKNELK